MLRNSREEKGLTFDDVSSALYIRKRVIGAIETGDWSNLPHPVYVKGYINQYAALLSITDLIEAELISIEKEAPPEVQETPVVPRKDVAPRGWGFRKKLTAASALGAVVKDVAPRGWGFRKKLTAASALGAVVVGFLIFQNVPKAAYVAPPVQPTGSNYRTVRADTPDTNIQPVGASAGAVSLEPAPVASEQGEQAASEPKKLTIACQEKTWVRIIIDGLEQKEFTLNPEEVVMLNAKENFDLIIGNAGGVKLFYNGKDTGFTGEYGEVKHISLS